MTHSSVWCQACNRSIPLYSLSICKRVDLSIPTAISIYNLSRRISVHKLIPRSNCTSVGDVQTGMPTFQEADIYGRLQPDGGKAVWPDVGIEDVGVCQRLAKGTNRSCRYENIPVRWFLWRLWVFSPACCWRSCDRSKSSS